MSVFNYVGFCDHVISPYVLDIVHSLCGIEILMVYIQLAVQGLILNLFSVDNRKATSIVFTAGDCER